MVQSYKISKVVAVKLSPCHIPYFGYAIIEGPKGGKALIDLFNLEQLLFARDSRLRAIRLETAILSYANSKGILRYVSDLDTSDKGLSDIAKKHSIEKLIRKGNRSCFYKFNARLNIDSELEYFENVCLRG